MIKPSSKICVDKSPIHGLGVFALEPIASGEIIEICPVIDIGMRYKENSGILIDYRFNWPQGVDPIKQVVPIGFGMIYNHSSNNNNAAWRSNLKNFTFEFYAVKDIGAKEEICTYYGDINYWNDGRNNTVVV